MNTFVNTIIKSSTIIVENKKTKMIIWSCYPEF